MKLDMSGKNVLVCGSTAGIGKATAMVFAEMGANVILMARNEQKLKSVLTELATTPQQNHAYLIADFFKPEEVENSINDYLANNAVIHVLVNNTGGPSTGPLLEKHSGEFFAFFNQHLICSHLLARAIVPGMQKVGYGRIINITSNAAKQPLPNMGLSNTIRGAVANWAKTLANELGEYGITVNNVLPGATDTKELRRVIANKAKQSGKSEDEVIQHMYGLCPAKRFADPIEIAWAVGFLASPQAAYINGINLVVDGGKTLSL